ncbi:hypothetical protein CPB85DRAFT_1025164 [Mucidula mucida]|nr:hypothetical protein CPB85DRAFT_1025164 [Mucidula mucida]
MAESDSYRDGTSISSGGCLSRRPAFLSYLWPCSRDSFQHVCGYFSLTTMSALQAQSRHLSAYTAACFAIRGLMQTVALELGQHNITVNLLAHSVLLDPTVESVVAALGSRSGWDLQGITKYMADRTPLPKKAATSQDIVPVVSMLASKECDFMTGQTISINGGMMMN